MILKMKKLIEKYQRNIHFAVNFYAVFLVITFIPDIVGVPPALITYPYWGLKILLALLIIYYCPVKQHFKHEFLYFLVVGIYAVNIFINGCNPPTSWRENNAFFDLSLFIVGIVIAFSFRDNPLYYSEKSFKYFWTILSVGVMLAIGLGKQSEVEITKYDANSIINSIVYGNSSVTLALVSLWGFINFKVKNRRNMVRLLFTITFFIGFVGVLKAGSRSTLLIAAFVIVFYLFAKLGSIKGILSACLLAAAIYMLLPQINLLSERVDSGIFSRVEDTIEEGKTNGRDVLYLEALREIEYSPIFGSYYQLSSQGHSFGYPHNYILEAFMTTGFVGGIPFLILLTISLSKCYRLIKTNHPATWIVIVYLSTFILGMFSTALYNSETFWILLFFILSIKQYDKSSSCPRLPLRIQSFGTHETNRRGITKEFFSHRKRIVYFLRWSKKRKLC
jgi:O-antigen ligase